jgi:nicotinamide mononucleotide transporter
LSLSLCLHTENYIRTQFMDILDKLQWLAFGGNMLFIILLIANKRIAWLFGILAAALSIYIFYASNFVSEAYLNVFYVIMGVYGWIYWSRGQKRKGSVPIVEYKWYNHVVLILGATGLALMMGGINKHNPHASVAYADAFSTSFAFMATFLEARKVLSAWLYWIAINIYSIWLYGQKTTENNDLTIMQIQMAVFGVFSILGYFVWKRQWNGKKVSMSKLKPA